MFPPAPPNQMHQYHRADVVANQVVYMGIREVIGDACSLQVPTVEGMCPASFCPVPDLIVHTRGWTRDMPSLKVPTSACLSF